MATNPDVHLDKLVWHSSQNAAWPQKVLYGFDPKSGQAEVLGGVGQTLFFVGGSLFGDA